MLSYSLAGILMLRYNLAGILMLSYSLAEILILSYILAGILMLSSRLAGIQNDGLNLKMIPILEVQFPELAHLASGSYV